MSCDELSPTYGHELVSSFLFLHVTSLCLLHCRSVICIPINYRWIISFNIWTFSIFNVFIQRFVYYPIFFSSFFFLLSSILFKTFHLIKLSISLDNFISWKLASPHPLSCLTCVNTLHVLVLVNFTYFSILPYPFPPPLPFPLPYVHSRISQVDFDWIGLNWIIMDWIRLNWTERGYIVYVFIICIWIGLD